MVVKDKRGRRRYILFTAGGAEEKDVRSSIRRHAPRIKLIFYDGTYGVVRCQHTEKDAVIDQLNRLEICGQRVTTLKTSGTIKKLKRYIDSIGSRESEPGGGFFLAYGALLMAFLLRNWCA